MKESGAADTDVMAAAAFEVEVFEVEGLSVMEASPDEVEHLNLRSTSPAPEPLPHQMVTIALPALQSRSAGCRVAT